MNGGGAGFFTPDVAAPASRLGMMGQSTWECVLSPDYQLRHVRHADMVEHL